MIGTKKVSLIIILLILSGCSTVCNSDTYCEKKVNWNDPTFKVLRSVLSNGISTN